MRYASLFNKLFFYYGSYITRHPRLSTAKKWYRSQLTVVANKMTSELDDDFILRKKLLSYVLIVASKKKLLGP